ncbi:MAG: DUF3794 domain-containing protein [Clostridia bacterium]|nr:DUF3794 domain-containing protein [Clostridia bacterium]
MELKLTRDTLRCERLAVVQEEQVSVEGEATLPGSMRDAVTVLSVQAQAMITGAQAGTGEAGIRGRVRFQVLYTQGDLTRIRAMETSCTFEHAMRMEQTAPGMRIEASACVQETDGRAASGRMALRALIALRAEAIEPITREVITDAAGGDGLQRQRQSLTCCTGELLGEEKTLVREEFDLPARLETGGVLTATGSATAEDITGGSARTGVSGKVEVRVIHRPAQGGRPLMITTHELPYELTLPAPLPEGAQPVAQAEVVDVMADADEKQRTLRVEAEVRVTLRLRRLGDAMLLDDLYTLRGEELTPVYEEIDVHTGEQEIRAREGVRLQASLPQEAQPIGSVLACFAQPTLLSLSPAGRRLEAEGLMRMTLIYLPADSDIPACVHVREPFAVTFPAETAPAETAAAPEKAAQDVRGWLTAEECTASALTSDRAEVRCVLALHAAAHSTRRIRAMTDVQTAPEQQRESGFVLVWPAAGETRWDTARRLRVAPDSLRPAGKSALLAFRRQGAK